LKRTKFAKHYIAIILILFLIGFCLWFFLLRFYKYTDDAYVEGNQIIITPLIPSFVKAIHSDDTFLIKKGQLLIELDDTDAKIALKKAEESFATTVREVCQLFHQVFAYQAEIEIKRALFVKAKQDFDHRQHVVEEGGVSVENYEHSIAALTESIYSLQMTEVLYKKSLAMIQNTSIRNHPMVLNSAAKLVDAWVNLYRCKIYSPVEGLGAQRTIQVGKWVAPGEPLMSVIPLDQIWVNANYKETQLKKMRIGQSVKVTADLYGRGVIFHGTILGLPGGAGNAFSLLPPQNLSGNWIKIVQRLPVRVGLRPEELKKHPLRIGLSMEATTDVHDISGEMVPETTAGSPTYETPIYRLEEIGSELLIEKIFNENFDPHLEFYKTTPFIPREIQKSGNSQSGAQDFDQDLAGAEAAPVVHRGNAGGSKDWDADRGSSPFLKHERYIEK
jgi:membrane fusion protein (multidrug efflux system)